MEWPFLVSIISKNIIRKAERFKQMKTEEEAPVIIMDMTRALGFETTTTAFTASSSRKSVVENSSNYTLDTLDDIDDDD